MYAAPPDSAALYEAQVRSTMHARRYWMPDKQCKSCTKCELPFTLLRRRHHCRFCGKIFCHTCSSQTMDGRIFGFDGHVRVCDDCKATENLLHRSSAQAADSPLLTAVSPPRADGGEIFSPTASGRDLQSGIADSSAVRHMDGLQGPAATHGAMEFDGGGGGVTIFEDRSRLSAPKAPLFSQPANAAVAEALRSMAEIADAHLVWVVARAVQHYFPSPQQVPSLHASTVLTTELQKAWYCTILSLVRHVVLHTDPNVRLGDRSDIRLYVKVKAVPDPPAEIQRILRAPQFSMLSPVSAEIPEQASLDGMIEEPLALPLLVPQQNAAGAESDSFSRVGKCDVINGLMFRKCLPHKGMKSDITSPRVIIIDDSISFDAGNAARIMSLDTLIDQERRYTDILVSKVLALRPDVVFVSKTVSRLAQELLLRGGVSVVSHVRLAILHRVSRCTGARILPSTNYIDKLPEAEVVGLNCKRFYVKDMFVPPDWFGDGPSPSQVRVDSDPLAVQRDLVKRSRATYVFLDECPANVGCTLLIRGSPEDVKTVKRIIHHSLLVARHLRLQVAYQLDSFICPSASALSVDSEFHLLLRGFLPDRIQPLYEYLPPHVKWHLVSLCKTLPGTPFLDILALLAGFGPRATRTGFDNAWPSPSDVGDMLHISDAFESLAVAHCYLSEGAQCLRPRVRVIKFYSSHDRSLGQFLEERCFNEMIPACRSCRRSHYAHIYCYIHHRGRLEVSVQKIPYAISSLQHLMRQITKSIPDQDSGYEHIPLPHVASDRTPAMNSSDIHLTTYCEVCNKFMTALTPLSRGSWSLSFGKFLENVFYGGSSCRSAAGACNHNPLNFTKYFVKGKTVATFKVVPIVNVALATKTGCNENVQWSQGAGTEQVHRLLQVMAKVTPEVLRCISELQSIINQLVTLLNKRCARVLESKDTDNQHAQTPRMQGLGAESEGSASALDAKVATDALAPSRTPAKSTDTAGALPTHWSDEPLPPSPAHGRIQTTKAVTLPGRSAAGDLAPGKPAASANTKEPSTPGRSSSLPEPPQGMDASITNFGHLTKELQTLWGTVNDTHVSATHELQELLEVYTADQGTAPVDALLPAALRRRYILGISYVQTRLHQLSLALNRVATPMVTSFEELDGLTNKSLSFAEVPEETKNDSTASESYLASSYRDLRASVQKVSDAIQTLRTENEKSEDFGGHLALPIGMQDTVVAVHDNCLSSIIAYSLSADVYWVQLQNCVARAWERQNGYTTQAPQTNEDSAASPGPLKPQHADGLLLRTQEKINDIALHENDEEDEDDLETDDFSDADDDADASSATSVAEPAGQREESLPTLASGSAAISPNDSLPAQLRETSGTATARISLAPPVTGRPTPRRIATFYGSPTGSRVDRSVITPPSGLSGTGHRHLHRHTMTTPNNSPSPRHVKTLHKKAVPVTQLRRRHSIGSPDVQLGREHRMLLSSPGVVVGLGYGKSSPTSNHTALRQNGSFMTPSVRQSEFGGYRHGHVPSRLDAIRRSIGRFSLTSGDLHVTVLPPPDLSTLPPLQLSPVDESASAQKEQAAPLARAEKALMAAQKSVTERGLLIDYTHSQRATFSPVMDENDAIRVANPITITADDSSTSSSTALLTIPTPLPSNRARRQFSHDPVHGAVGFGTVSPIAEFPAEHEVAAHQRDDLPGREAALDAGAGFAASMADEQRYISNFGVGLLLPPAEMLLSDVKTDILHTFSDRSTDGPVTISVTTVWAMHFHALRELYLSSQKSFVQSLAFADSWQPSGGKSGAKFEKTHDRRFVLKTVSKNEFDMFNEQIAGDYFAHMYRALVEGISTLLVKTLGAYKIVYEASSPVGGIRRQTSYVIVMEDLFYERSIPAGLKFDLKGKWRAQKKPTAVTDNKAPTGGIGDATRMAAIRSGLEVPINADPNVVLLDGDFMAYTRGHPLPLEEEAKRLLDATIEHDTSFLCRIKVIDYSILLGVEPETGKMVVGLIDYIRRYDLLKKLETRVKTVTQLATNIEPTVIQPERYKERLQRALDRYFVMVPTKWTSSGDERSL